jgi:hypothetical protein
MYVEDVPSTLFPAIQPAGSPHPRTLTTSRDVGLSVEATLNPANKDYYLCIGTYLPTYYVYEES